MNMNTLQRASAIRAAIAAGAVVVALCPDTANAQSNAERRATAQVLFNDADALMTKHRYAEACPKLEEVLKLQPGKIGTMLALAQCYEHIGKLASAWASYLESEVAASALHNQREKLAHDSAAALAPRLLKLNIVVSPEVPPETVIRRDTTLIGNVQWGQALPIDPGSYRIEATCPGRKTWSTLVEAVGEAKVITVDIPALEIETVPVAPPEIAPVAAASPPPGVGGEAKSERERAPTAASAPGFGHAGQLGAFFRVDVDGELRGLVNVPGISYGLGDHFELAAAALIGRDQGFWLGGTAYILRGELKPLVTAGTHFFLTDGARVALHGAGGLQWDPNRHFGVFLLAGISYALSVPASNYDRLVFLPSLGLQARL